MRSRAMRRCCRLSVVHSDLRRMHSAPDLQVYFRRLRTCCHPGSPACFLPRIRRLIPAASGGAVIRISRFVSVIRIFRVISIIRILRFISAVVDFLKRICGCLERAGSFVDEALLIFRKILCQKLLCLRGSISQRLYASPAVFLQRCRNIFR